MLHREATHFTSAIDGRKISVALALSLTSLGMASATKSFFMYSLAT